MLQEFKMSLGYKITYGLLAAGIAAFGVFFLTISLDDKATSGIIVGLVFLFGAAAFAFYIIKRRVTITANEIIVNGLFGEKRRLINDIKGFRDNGKAIVIYPVGEQDKKLTINDYDAINGDDQFKIYLKSNLRDLDAEEFQAGLADILQSDEFGLSEDERKNSLSSAGRLAMFYNIFGIIVLIGSFFFIDVLVSSDLYSIVMISYPLVGIVLMATQKGLIKFATKKTSPLYSVYYSMFMSCIFLVVKPLIKYNLIDISTIWVPMGSVAVLFFGALYWKGKADAANAMKGQVLIMFFVALAFGYGFTTTVNCMFDTTKPQTFTAKIEKVYITTGKRTIYNVTVGPWGSVHESKSIQVAETVFYRMTVGNNIGIELRHGLFSMPWYQLKI
jgi:hypothetical protein